jgi:hypothetical protein
VAGARGRGRGMWRQLEVVDEAHSGSSRPGRRQRPRRRRGQRAANPCADEAAEEEVDRGKTARRRGGGGGGGQGKKRRRGGGRREEAAAPGMRGSRAGGEGVGVLDRQTYQGGTRGSRLCSGDRDQETENSNVCTRTRDTRFIQVQTAKVASPTSCLGDQVWRPALGVG